MNPKEKYYETISHTIIKNLEKRNIEGFYFKTADEAKEKALQMLFSGAKVAFGGSMTLFESGLVDALKEKEDIILYDREDGKTPEEVYEIFRKSLSTDYYFMSTNAITADGELVNIDGNGNRLAALIFGPDHVVVFAGVNKICSSIEDAYQRTKNIASAQNTIRLNKKTPCASTGICGDCYGAESICSHTVVTRRCNVKGRITVFMIGEALGY